MRIRKCRTCGAMYVGKQCDQHERPQVVHMAKSNHYPIAATKSHFLHEPVFGVNKGTFARNRGMVMA